MKMSRTYLQLVKKHKDNGKVTLSFSGPAWKEEGIMDLTTKVDPNPSVIVGIPTSNPWWKRKSSLEKMDEGKGSDRKPRLVGDQVFDESTYPSLPERSDYGDVPCSKGLEIGRSTVPGSIIDESVVDCWILSKDMLARYYNMWTNVEKYGQFHDVAFEVGAEKKVVITAHSLILSAKCFGFRKLFAQNQAVSRRGMVLQVPDLDPEGFKRMLHFIYAGTMEFPEFSLDQIFSTLKVGKSFHFDEFANSCFAFLRSVLTNENAAEMFQLAQTHKEETMEGLTRAHISNNISEVFSSKGFLKLSENALCAFLNMDGWVLDEIQVFNHVKRWAISQRPELLEQVGQICGQKLREAMGQAFYAIRFPIMAKDEFLAQIFVEHKGLFGLEELEQLIQYFLQKGASQPVLANFNSRPRGK